MKKGEITDMKTVLVSDDMYLVAGLRACDCGVLWLRSGEAMDYVADRASQRYLLIVDARTSAVDFLRIQTRWRSNDCVVWLHPRGKDALRKKADHAETFIAWGWELLTCCPNLCGRVVRSANFPATAAWCTCQAERPMFSRCCVRETAWQRLHVKWRYR